MIRHALDTLPNCLPSSNTPTLVLMTLSAVVISPRFLPAALRRILDYEDFIMTVRFSCSTYNLLIPLYVYESSARAVRINHISSFAAAFVDQPVKTQGMGHAFINKIQFSDCKLESP